jgi:large subunit ribosomal protein L3
MTQIFSETGQVVPVTIVEAGPCYVTQVKTDTSDEYNAIQIGFGEAKRINKPEAGHLKEIPALRFLREIRTDNAAEYERGQKLDVSIFDVGDLVDVVGTSKGKGFAGVVKRHHFRGGPITHGQSDRVRAPGSIGSGTTPGRVYKGMKMGGHMGAHRVTVQNLEVVLVDPERNLLAVRGAVPGAKQGLVMIHKARKN